MPRYLQLDLAESLADRPSVSDSDVIPPLDRCMRYEKRASFEYAIWSCIRSESKQNINLRKSIEHEKELKKNKYCLYSPLNKFLCHLVFWIVSVNASIRNRLLCFQSLVLIYAFRRS